MAEPYRDLLALADEHFRRATEASPHHFQCRKGCTLCCVGLFEIGAADVVVIADALERAEDDLGHDLIARAESIVERFPHPDLRETCEKEKDLFFDVTSEVPCPALGDDGSCRIYESRPLVCRTFGLPIREGEKFLGEECELNFINASRAERHSVAWDLEWEDVVGADDQYTIPEAILLAARMLNLR